MTAAPPVSVVMGVFNGASHLEPTVASVLSQRGVDLELVVVDDGSTDDTRAILAEQAERDERVRVFHAAHQGLTAALVRGCAEARGRIIARQDAGDISMPARLARQVEHLDADAGIALSSCWTRFVGPEDEALFELRYAETPDAATRRLRSPDVTSHRGIGHHGSAVFRRADYVRSGGYREQFAVAQDLDLWLRLTDRGALGFVPEVLYEARYSAGSLSARFGSYQRRLAGLALEMRKAREGGRSEAPLLEEASRIRPPQGRPSRATADADYFIGKCLLARGDARAARYFRNALRIRPWDLRAWAALGKSALGAW